MGSINLKHTGSGSAIALSSDGTSLLLDGTAIGGGALNLFKENYGGSSTLPNVTGTDAIGIGERSVSAGTASTSIGNSYSGGSGYNTSINIGTNSTSYGASGSGSLAGAGQAKATSNYGVALGYASQSTGLYGIALGRNSLASGSGSTAIGNSSGYTTTASGFSSFAIGAGSATGNSAIAIGKASSTNVNSVAIGLEAKAYGRGSLAFNGGAARGYAQIAFSTGQYSSTTGQGGIYPFRASTTDATAIVMTTQGVSSNGNATVSADNQLLLQNEGAITFTGTVVCREDATDGDDYAGWEIKGIIMRGTGASTTVLGAGIVNPLYHTSALASADVTLSADTTNGCLKIEVTGAAATNLFWYASVYTSEVVNT